MKRASNIVAACLAAWLMLVASTGLAQPGGAPTEGEPDPSIKQVLMLQSLDRGNTILDQFTRDFRAGLELRSSSRVNVVQIVVGPTGLVGAPEQAVVDYIRAMYHDLPPPDLVLSVGGPAALFARKHRQALFPGTPLLLGSVDQRFLRNAPLGDNESAVSVDNDFPRLVDDILQVLPDTDQIYVLIGSGPIASFWRGQLEFEFRRFRDSVRFVWLDDPSPDGILRRGAGLPRNSAIIYVSAGTHARGAYDDEEVLAGIRAKAGAPLFAAFTPLFGHGIVGGSMMPISELAHTTAGVAAQILGGVPAGSLRFPPQKAGGPVFDARELSRWDIPESRLPPGSIVQFRAPSAWDQYGRVILVATTVLVLQSLLIAWLLYERRARRRAETDSRSNLALAADANRRETIATLATSIGHELGQPLSAILHSSQALRMMIAADGARPDATAEILAEIQAEAVLATQIIERHRAMLRSHQMDMRPIDLRSVVDESLALVANEMKTRRVEVVMAASSTPCEIEGDPVLLKQVLVNLVRNAADALDAMPLATRRITIATVATALEVELSVSDTGPGLPAEITHKLFDPFVTTKPKGLGIGLAIAQRLIQAHGGRIVARDNCDGGATFTISLPRHAKAMPSANVIRDTA